MMNGGSLDAVAELRPAVAEVLAGVAAAVPVVVLADGHVRERVDVRAAVRRAADRLGHVAEVDLVARPPGLDAVAAQPAGRAVHASRRRAGARRTAACR